MCGIFGIISQNKVINKNHIKLLSDHAKERGRESSGVIYFENSEYKIRRADNNINKLVSKKTSSSNLFLGHSSMLTNSLKDSQPLVRKRCVLIHDGLIVNHEELWGKINLHPHLKNDSEIILGITESHLKNEGKVEEIPEKILSLCKGTISCALVFPEEGMLLLFSNNGSLYTGSLNNNFYFSSEKHPLEGMGCDNIKQLLNDYKLLKIPISNILDILNSNDNNKKSVPAYTNIASKEALLKYETHNLKRCTKCILSETMPFIKFDSQGVCNYCNNYKLVNQPRSKKELFDLVEPYRSSNGPDCIVPFSGGRDSSYALDVIVNELKMKPVTYTYDWGMITDLARRNISRMCSILGVENIMIAADIAKKRRNIRLNLEAWLKTPDLGMLNILTAGDKHFFKYIETVKNQTKIDLNFWGINPLEVTHFKAGFLGIKPNFIEDNVYTTGALKQMFYHSKRFKAMLKSPGYFNRSLWDTWTGEYYRSFTEKKDYYHVFNYWTWDENIVEDSLKKYDWELAPDTTTSWRIGDGTAGFYDYVYYSLAGFTEHDTLRSNQIREGQITREEALRLIEDENRPRYQNIKWYLDALGMDFVEVIKKINITPKLY